jgi:spoIIIJ-associated protein
MADEEQKQRAIAFAKGLAEASGLDVSAEIRWEEPDGVTIAFDGPDARLLIGRSGQSLDALQYLCSLVVNRRGAARIHITFDADGYRLRRENTLVKLASDLAQQVIATGQEAVLDPMSALERRIVHNALAGEPGVRTYSEGEEPERYLVIAPAASAT